MKHPEDFEDGFKKSFENARIVPDKEVWGRVGQVMRAKRKKARLYRLAGAAMVCSFLTLSWMVFDMVAPKKTNMDFEGQAKQTVSSLKYRSIAKEAGKAFSNAGTESLAHILGIPHQQKNPRKELLLEHKNKKTVFDKQKATTTEAFVLVAGAETGGEVLETLPAPLTPLGFVTMGKPNLMSLSMPVLKAETEIAEALPHAKLGSWFQASAGGGQFEPKFIGKAATGAHNINLANAYSSAVLNSTSVPAVQFGASLQFGGHLSKRWQLAAGLEAVRQNLKMEVPVSYVESNPTAFGNPYKAVMNDTQLRVLVKTRTSLVSLSNTYVGIPLTLYYRTTQTKLSLDFMAGLSLRYTARSVFINDGDTYTTGFLHNPFEAFGINAKIGANLSYPITKKWHICLMPSFERSLSSQIKNSKVNLKPHSFDVGLGIRKSF